MSGISVRLLHQVARTLVGCVLEFGFGNLPVKIDPRMRTHTDLAFGADIGGVFLNKLEN